MHITSSPDAFGVLVAATAAVLTVVLLVLRRLALPRAIPGIPYNETSARRISGDGPEMSKAAQARRVRAWMRSQFALHNSPIVQVFIQPFGKPHVLVSDFRESQDILIRRTKEFDRSIRSIEAFSGLVANAHIAMRSADPRFALSKHLVKDLMSPTFLNEVSAPEIHEKISSLLELWILKARDANGRPFEASKDLDIVSLDVIMAVAFDVAKGNSTIARQVSNWEGHGRQHREGGTVTQEEEPSSNPDKTPFPFPSPELDPEWQACVYLTNSIAVPFRSRMPRLAHWLYLQRPSARRMLRLKNRLIARNIDQGLARLQESRRAHAQVGVVGDELKHMKLKCAVDQILLRELTTAEKLGISPDFHKPAIYDELFVYIIAGHDTVSSTLSWWVKYAARYQTSQNRLRSALYAAHPKARAEGRLPTADEIAYASVPYLQAVIQETLRFSHIAPAVLRQTTVDTQILGCWIPKGTDVFLNSSAASFMTPAFEIDEERRSDTARKASDLRAWDPADIGEFVPERWLKQLEEAAEVEVFDSQAGPMMGFGIGHRACFGRKLVYLDMQIALTLLVWSFEFLEMDNLDTLEDVDSISRRPRDCYVTLKIIT